MAVFPDVKLMGYGVLPARDLMFMQNLDEKWNFLMMDGLGNEFSLLCIG